MRGFPCILGLVVALYACEPDLIDDAADAGAVPGADAGDAGGASEPPEVALPKDTDSDGLCDRTERQFGTDSQARDTDADGLPDLIEVGNGFDAASPDDPAQDQVAYLVGEPGSALEFPVRMTVQGDGQALSGYFEVIPSIYADGVTAQDFFRGTMATAADPVDGVRSVQPGSARFAGVLGRTRLSFALRFEYPEGAAVVECGRAYPLRYALRSDDGMTVAERLFLLVVAPEVEADLERQYCLPTRCQ
jgi:hypothetical protein